MNFAQLGKFKDGQLGDVGQLRRPVPDAHVFFQKSVDTIESAMPRTADYQSLGVFAVPPQTTTAGAAPTIFIQLAVSKEGVIAGTVHNTETEKTESIEGMVDQKTQRAAWGFADGKDTHIVMETGIYNLTENEASVLVHFGPDKRQEGTLVRLEAPKEDKKDAKGGGNAKPA